MYELNLYLARETMWLSSVFFFSLPLCALCRSEAETLSEAEGRLCGERSSAAPAFPAFYATFTILVSQGERSS